MGKLVVSLSPHAHGNDSIERNMYGVIVALLPALFVSFFYFGLGAVIVTLSSVAFCMFFEWVITKYLLRQEPTLRDGSAIITGLLLGMNLPSNLPLWILILGALFAIGVAKMSFGGLGCNPFNPALAARCFLLVSFPAQMTSWPVAGQITKYLDAETGATPLAIMKQAIKAGDGALLVGLPDSFHLLLGNNPTGGLGTIGEVCSLALLAGFVFMLWRKIITWHIPISIIGTVFVVSAFLHLANPDVYVTPVQEILTGGLMLGAIFMATDYVTSPMTAKGQIIYGVAIGMLTLIIRNWGSYPEGMSFAILIMNGFTPLINYYIKPVRYGKA